MIVSQLAIIEQAQVYLNSVNQEQFTQIIKPQFISSAGSHIRHIIDHYLAIKQGMDKQFIDYDERSRGKEIESSPALANKALTDIAQWLKGLSPQQLEQSVVLSTEVSITTKKIQLVKTSVARELIFASSHAVHHYAIIAQIVHHQQKQPPTNFGIAPATATYLRDTNETTCIIR
jgi:hypothetical protein